MTSKRARSSSPTGEESFTSMESQGIILLYLLYLFSYTKTHFKFYSLISIITICNLITVAKSTALNLLESSLGRYSLVDNSKLKFLSGKFKQIEFHYYFFMNVHYTYIYPRK